MTGQRFETATGRFVKALNWSQERGKAIGNTTEVKELNAYLDVLRAKAFDIQKKLITIGVEVTTEEFAKHWRGVKEKARMLLEKFKCIGFVRAVTLILFSLQSLN